MCPYLMANYLWLAGNPIRSIWPADNKVKWYVMPRSLIKLMLIKYQQSTCNNHRAQNNGSVQCKHLDSTGKGACACARHGAFIPRSVVDFQKGER